MVSKIGKVIERILNQHEWSMEDISEKCGIAVDRLIQISTSECEMTEEEIQAIASGLHLSRGEILGRKVAGLKSTLPDIISNSYTDLSVEDKKRVTVSLWRYLETKGQPRELEVAADLYSGQSVGWRSGKTAMHINSIAAIQYSFEDLGVTNQMFLDELEKTITSCYAMNKIAKWKEEACITTSQLAKICNINQVTLSQLFGLRGLHVSKKYATKLSLGTGIDLSELELYPGQFESDAVLQNPADNAEPENCPVIETEPSEEDTDGAKELKAALKEPDPSVDCSSLVSHMIRSGEEMRAKMLKMIPKLSPAHIVELYTKVEEYFWEDI